MERKWYVVFDDQTKGPFTSQAIHHLIGQGKLNNESFIWAEGMKDWAQIKVINEFQPVIPSKPSIEGLNLDASKTKIKRLFKKSSLVKSNDKKKTKSCTGIGCSFLILAFVVFAIITSFEPYEPNVDDAKRVAEEEIRTMLKDPDSAKFDHFSKYATISKGSFLLWMNVRAKNSFGAYVTSVWQCNVGNKGTENHWKEHDWDVICAETSR